MSWFAVLWRGFFIPISFGFLCVGSFAFLRPNGREKIFLASALGALGDLERGSLLVRGAGRRVLELAAPRVLSSSLRDPAGHPRLGTGGSDFPSHPPRLNIIS